MGKTAVLSPVWSLGCAIGPVPVISCGLISQCVTAQAAAEHSAHPILSAKSNVLK